MAKQNGTLARANEDKRSGDDSGASTRAASVDFEEDDPFPEFEEDDLEEEDLATDPALADVSEEDLVPVNETDREDGAAMANGEDPVIARFVEQGMRGRANPYLLAFRA